MLFEKNGIVSVLRGEFLDRETEKDYVNHDVGNAKKYLNPLVLFLGVLYFLFIIPDFIILDTTPKFFAILINRTTVLCLIVLLYLKLKSAQSYGFFHKWIAVYQIIVFISFFFTLLRYDSPNILIQTFGMMLIVISLFLLPSRWIYTFFVSLIFIFIFYIITGFLENALYERERTASLVFLLIVLVISGISALRTNYYKRMQYINENRLLEISMTDPLTGCNNRLVSNKEFEKIYSTDREHKETSVILFDLDNFKSINDKYGHLAGDKILVEIVELIKPLLKKNYILIRWGGEEFLVLLKGSGVNEAISLSEKIQDSLNNHVFDNDLQVTCSFGVVSSNECSNVHELLIKSDKRMYEAKRLGKNRIIGKDITNSQ